MCVIFEIYSRVKINHFYACSALSARLFAKTSSETSQVYLISLGYYYWLCGSCVHSLPNTRFAWHWLSTKNRHEMRCEEWHRERVDKSVARSDFIAVAMATCCSHLPPVTRSYCNYESISEWNTWSKPETFNKKISIWDVIRDNRSIVLWQRGLMIGI